MGWQSLLHSKMNLNLHMLKLFQGKIASQKVNLIQQIRVQQNMISGVVSHFLILSYKWGGGVSLFLFLADKGGGGVCKPPFLADIICEQPLSGEGTYSTF